MVGVVYFGSRLAIKVNDGPIVWLSCGLDQFIDTVGRYEKKGHRVVFCDSEKELDEIFV